MLNWNFKSLLPSSDSHSCIMTIETFCLPVFLIFWKFEFWLIMNILLYPLRCKHCILIICKKEAYFVHLEENMESRVKVKFFFYKIVFLEGRHGGSWSHHTCALKLQTCIFIGKPQTKKERTLRWKPVVHMCLMWKWGLPKVAVVVRYDA
jgi:hypothetical protein